MQAGAGRDDRRDRRLLERPGRRDDVARVDVALRGLDPEAGSAVALADGGDLDTGAHGGVDHPGVLLEVRGHPILRGELVGAEPGDLQPGEAVVPRGAVGDERVPPHGAPPLGDAITFEDDVCDAARAEVLAHRDAGLSGADHDDVGLLDRTGPGGLLVLCGAHHRAPSSSRSRDTHPATGPNVGGRRTKIKQNLMRGAIY